VDQFFRLEQQRPVHLQRHRGAPWSSDAEAVVCRPTTYQHVVNASATEPLRLYTIYTPPQHPDGTVHKTKAEAEAAEAAEHHTREFRVAQVISIVH